MRNASHTATATAVTKMKKGTSSRVPSTIPAATSMAQMAAAMAAPLMTITYESRYPIGRRRKAVTPVNIARGPKAQVTEYIRYW